MGGDNQGVDDDSALRATALENMPIAMLVLDEHGRVRWVNHQAATFGQRPRTDMLGLEFGEATGCVHAREGCTTAPACDGCPLESVIRETLETGKNARMVELGRPFERPGVLDSPRVAVSASRTISGGQVRVVLAVQTLHSGQAPARESADLVTVTNALAEALFTVRLPERRIEYVNRAAEELFGRPARDMVGQLTTILYPDEDGALEFGAKLAASLAAGEPQLRTEHVFHRHGTGDFWGAVSTTFLYEGGEPARVISVVSDISARKRMEQELRASEQRYRAVFSRAPVGIALFDIDSGRYLAANDRQCELCGHPHERLLELEFFADTHPDDAGAETDALQALREFSEVVNYEKRLVRADGELAYVRVALMVLGDGEHDQLAMAIVEDITERRRLDKEKAHIAESLRERQKLDSLGMLAGGIAHDFNNFLGVVSLNTDLARASVAGNERASQQLATIADATKQAAELTRQLLAYAGQGRLVVQRINITEVIESMRQLLRLSISSNVTLEFSLEPLVVVEADTTQLRQIVMNLVTNAAQALPSGRGRVEVVVREQQLEYRAQLTVVPSRLLDAGRYAVIEVIDEGHGIEPALLTKIFDPFYTTKTTGHGLGLSAILGIANAHRGGIQVDSVAGHGTCMRVLLPIADGTVQAQRATRSSSQSWRGSGRVLVVEDEPILRVATRQMLEYLGFSVVEAKHGAEAVELLRAASHSFAFVLLDLTMPVMNGLEALEHLRSFDQDVPVILVSGFTKHALSERYKHAGFNGFLHKPYDLQELISALRTVSESRA